MRRPPCSRPSRGDHVVLLARGARALTRVADACQARGAASTLALPTDVRDDTAVREAVADAVAEHGRLDVVVGNAGVVAYGRLEEVPVEVFDGVLETNLHGSVNLARHVLPVLRAQRSGALVLVGSLIGHLAVPDMSAYVLSKWGVRALVRQLRVDNRDRPGLRIGYVAPGGVDTPIYAQAATYGDAVGSTAVPRDDPGARRGTGARGRRPPVAPQPGRRRQRPDQVRVRSPACGLRPTRRAAVPGGRPRT